MRRLIKKIFLSYEFIGFALANLVLIWDIIVNGSVITILSVFIRYIAAITIGFLMKKYSKYYRHLHLLLINMDNRFSGKILLQCSLLWGTVYFGLGFGTITSSLLVYSYLFGLHLSIDKQFIFLCADIYKPFCIGGFCAGNLLYLYYLFKKRIEKNDKKLSFIHNIDWLKTICRGISILVAITMQSHILYQVLENTIPPISRIITTYIVAVVTGILWGITILQIKKSFPNNIHGISWFRYAAWFFWNIGVSVTFFCVLILQFIFFYDVGIVQIIAWFAFFPLFAFIIGTIVFYLGSSGKVVKGG